MQSDPHLVLTTDEMRTIERFTSWSHIEIPVSLEPNPYSSLKNEDAKRKVC